MTSGHRGPCSSQKRVESMGDGGCPPPLEGEMTVRVSPTLFLAGPSAPCPARTSITFIHADVEVAAEGGCIDDTVSNLVVGRGVFICCLEGTGQTGPGEPTKGPGTGDSGG